jgi:hypothetical protein
VETTVRSVIYPNEIDRIIRKPGGPVGVVIRRFSLDIAKNAEDIARAELGNRHPSDAPRTGRYARSFSVKVETNPNGYQFVVANNAKQAAVLELGSQAHTIKPRRAKYLRFRSRKDGQMKTVKVVNHPGQKIGYFIMRRATAQAVRNFRR